MKCSWKLLEFGFMYMCLASPLRFCDFTGKKAFFSQQSARQRAAYSSSVTSTDLSDMVFPLV